MVKHSLEKVKELYSKFNNESDVARELGVSRQFMHEFRIKNNIVYDKLSARKATHLNRYEVRNAEISRLYLLGVDLGVIKNQFKLSDANLGLLIRRIRKNITK
jgi:hypothetical protein